MVGGAALLANQVSTREAHQLWVGGIVRAAGPDPFGNCMPLPCITSKSSVWGKLRGSFIGSYGTDFEELLCHILCLEGLARRLVVHCILDYSSLDCRLRGD